MLNQNPSSSVLQLPSNRKFGLFFFLIFAVLGAYAYTKAWFQTSITALTIAILFAVVALIIPQVLSRLNRLWYGLGQLLGAIVSPIVLGVMFFGLITPISLITRLFGRDELKMKKRAVNSYWIDRLPPGPSPDSFNNQY
jgi:hypothetical protein